MSATEPRLVGDGDQAGSIPRLGPLATLLADAFALLAARMPAGHALLRSELTDWKIPLDLDHERVWIRITSEHIHVQPREPEVPPMVVSSSAGILAVVDAEVTLAEAVERDLVFVRATLEQLERLHSGLLIFLHAAVRCSAFPALLLRLRRHADRRERPSSESAA